METRTVITMHNDTVSQSAWCSDPHVGYRDAIPGHRSTKPMQIKYYIQGTYNIQKNFQILIVHDMLACTNSDLLDFAFARSRIRSLGVQ